jgi:hypothetical protein
MNLQVNQVQLLEQQLILKPIFQEFCCMDECGKKKKCCKSFKKGKRCKKCPE